MSEIDLMPDTLDSAMDALVREIAERRGVKVDRVTVRDPGALLVLDHGTVTVTSGEQNGQAAIPPSVAMQWQDRGRILVQIAAKAVQNLEMAMGRVR